MNDFPAPWWSMIGLEGNPYILMRDCGVVELRINGRRNDELARKLCSRIVQAVNAELKR